MNKFLIALTAAAAAAVCSSSQAAVVASVTPVTIATMPGYTGYKVTMTSTSTNGLIGGVEFTGANAIQQPLHQRWVFNGTKAVATPSNVPSEPQLDDSYFILDPLTTLAPAPGLLENNSLTGSPLANGTFDRYGMGTSLSGAWGYTTAGRAASVDVAYLVIKDTSLPANGVLFTSGVTEVVGTSNPVLYTVSVAVPEPTSLGFLVLTGAGLIARRRKA